MRRENEVGGMIQYRTEFGRFGGGTCALIAVACSASPSDEFAPTPGAGGTPVVVVASGGAVAASAGGAPGAGGAGQAPAPTGGATSGPLPVPVADAGREPPKYDPSIVFDWPETTP